MWFGLVIAAFAELSSFALIVYAGNFLLPAARVLGFAWLIWVGVSLPKSRVPRGESARPAPGTLTPAAQH
jgi:threonine/homoserine/homoserine lactone efflux protein